MNRIIQITNFLLINILYTYSIYLLIKSFFKESKNKKIELLSYFAYYFFLIILSFIIVIPVLRLFFNIMALFLISLNYKTLTKNRFIYIMLIYIMLMAIESLVVYLTGFDPNTLGSIQIYRSIYGKFLITISTFFWALSMKKLRFHKYNDNISFRTYISIFLSTLITFFLFIIIIYLKNVYLALISILLIIASTFLNIVIYDSVSKDVWLKYKYKEIENQNNYLETQNKLIKENDDKICRIKHDMKNHLFAINTLIKNKNYIDACQYIQNLNQVTDFEKKYVDTNNGLIDSLINYKFCLAKAKDINCIYKISLPKDLTIDSFSFITILSNLLDNAIRGAESHQSPELKLFIRYDKGIVFIKVENNYSQQILYKNNKIITTKKNISFEHGYGLSNVESAVKKLDGLITYNISDEIFIVNVLIYPNTERSK